MQKLVGIFGGTFDPIHLGHIKAVDQLCQELEFERVHWVLSARPPHKDAISASISARFEMLRLALSEYPLFLADDCEIKRQSKSYTIDTLIYFQEKYPDYRLCLIIGSDSLQQLQSWHRYRELLDMAHIIVMSRPGYEPQAPEYLSDRVVESLDALKTLNSAGIALYTHTDYDISSTRIRRMLADKQVSNNRPELQKVLPESVINYIQSQQSYKINSVNFEKDMNPENIKDQVVSALEDVKAKDIRVIDIADISDFADFMVVASGTSDTHVKALAREASDSLRKQGVKPLSEDGADIGEWVLVDFGDVVLHVMRPEVREYYDLEKLWDEDVRELVKKHREGQDSQGL